MSVHFDHDLLLPVVLCCVCVSSFRVIYCILFGAFDNCLKKILRIRRRFACCATGSGSQLPSNISQRRHVAAKQLFSVLLCFVRGFVFFLCFALVSCHTFDPKWLAFIKRYWSQGLHGVNCVAAN